MNITSLATPLNIQTPDLALMSTSLNIMNNNLVTADVLYSKTLYLNNLYERFKRINKTIMVERQRLGESSARLRIEIESRTVILREYEQELNAAKDQADISEIQEERAHILTSSITMIGTEANRLANVLSEMKEAFDRQQTLDFQKGLEKDVIQKTGRIEATTNQLATIQEERRVLSEAIDAIESKGFETIAKDTLLTAEKVIALGLQPPQIAVVTLAIEQMKATLEYGAEGLNFIALIKRRDSLRERIEKLFEELAQREQEKLALAQRIELIECFHTMDDQRSVYVEQYQKIVQTVESFVALNKALAADDEERSARFIRSGLQLTSYLQPIR
ncbi:alpha-xenorhabdolysin family binary toxin subunit B [Pseudomonas cichorii]|uniref:alpha-xenorhabdolysin family binary toxin subunit B n=1 Tax=Pseudomonas cichorii TaxID=36746 RepID=UPI0018E5FFEF|nr:alpha-xenorhabdolysin family binary toxin subunit B [Pseudomonas cichorii]MBI6856042.1 alpha-xenorhabdolysin family binary toxin subunit B [Pseudomonas cichorii]